MIVTGLCGILREIRVGSEPTASPTPADEADHGNPEKHDDGSNSCAMRRHLPPQFFFAHVQGSRVPAPGGSAGSVAPSPARLPRMSSPIVYPGGSATPQPVATMNGSSPGSTPGYRII